tara:strand:- start:399 stop:587 length:189 start_codon:yes stop_codon:yes gene_type:complete
MRYAICLVAMVIGLVAAMPAKANMWDEFDGNAFMAFDKTNVGQVIAKNGWQVFYTVCTSATS